MRVRLAAAIAATTALVLLLGPSASGLIEVPTVSAPAPSAPTLQVVMTDNQYEPQDITGVVDIMGVHFVNQGAEFHNVLFDPGPRWFTTNLDEGQDDDTQLLYAGTFDFRCTYHDEMRGTLRVEPFAPMTSGRAGDRFTIEVAATDPAEDGYAFRVERRRNGGAWTRRAGVDTPTFTVKLRKAGRYDYRVRLTEPGLHSDWSPLVRIRVHD